MKTEFRTEIGRDIFYDKYAKTHDQSWHDHALTLTTDVCGRKGVREHPLMTKSDLDRTYELIRDFKWLPGGRYHYYAGRKAKFWNNCFLLRAEEDTREEWSAVVQRSMACLMLGGGIGIDYSVIRPRGRILHRTGGIASGPVALMHAVNAVGQQVRQGGGRRAAIYASLNWRHDDILEFMHAKDWDTTYMWPGGPTYGDWKRNNFDGRAPLDYTNISLNYDDYFMDELLINELPETFLLNCRQAMMTGEPGFSFNFGDKERETLRNACTEVVSEDDSDCCNLGSVNMAAIDDLEEFKETCYLGAKFLICGSIRSELPYERAYDVRERNRRIGVGLMGLHEWLLKRGYSYEMNDELEEWLYVYKEYSEKGANEHCDRFFLTRPKGYRAIAPTGTIGNLAGTTTGIEPIFATAYKRRYVGMSDEWRYQLVVDPIARILVDELGVDPDKIETSLSLADDYERRIAMQFYVQQHVDMGISSTINLPKWGSELNNEDKVEDFALTLAKYAHGLRGLTFYPDGARGGQPLTPADYRDAIRNEGTIFKETDVCELAGKGSCEQ